MRKGRTRVNGSGLFERNVGGDLLSHTLTSAVPSALEGLASGFGMGPGVTPPPQPPTTLSKSTNKKPITSHHTSPRKPGKEWSCAQGHIVDANNVLWSSPRPISTGQLHPSRGFHLRPINPMVSRGPYPRKGGGIPHLGTSFPLRCLQRLSLPNIANQPCPWRDNWHTRGSSVPVLSY